MKRALFVIIGEKGHIHPFLGPAAQLEARGVEVAFYAPVDIGSAITRAGFSRFFSGVSDEVTGAPPPAVNRGQAFAQLVADASRLRSWIRSVLLDRVPVQIERLRAVVRDYRPSLIVIDPMMYAGAIVAGVEKLPWAGLSTSLNPVVGDDMPSELLDTTRFLDADRKALFAQHGLSARFRVCDAMSPFLNVCFSTPALIQSPPPDVELMGPSLPNRARGDECSFPWERLDGRPIVMMSFGSQIYHQPDSFRAVIAATATLGVQLMCSVGDLDFGPLPDHVLTVPYFPQLELLERSAIFITHGGANSVMEALAYGVPMLVSPICNDQFHNAEFVRRARAGLVLDVARADVARIRAAIAALLCDGELRAGTARVAASYRNWDGAGRTADRLMHWLS
jgi:zeaxanthin glucosyltransferase